MTNENITPELNKLEECMHSSIHVCAERTYIAQFMC